MIDNRRNFIKTAMVGSLFPSLTSRCSGLFEVKKETLKENDILLFQGDSITDAFRVRDNFAANHQRALGVGFVHNIASFLLGKYPEKKLKIYNRGIGGNKVSQLIDRWDGDAISLKPNVLTIVIGINDYFYFEKNNIPVGKYYDDYRKLVETTLKKFPDLILIIGEPFCIDSPNVERDFLLEFQSATKRISDEFHANFIPLQTIFNRALDFASRSYWSREGDGIHPSIAGAHLLETAWLNLFEL